MGPVLVVTSERLDAATAGPGLRALGIAAGLRERGVPVELAAPGDSSANAGIPTHPLESLARAVRDAEAVIVPAALVNQFPEVRAARRLCVDFAGPYPLEARASGLPPRAVAAADRSAADALCSADLVLCSQPRQIDYAIDLAHRVHPESAISRDSFAIVPFGISIAEPPLPTAHADAGLRLVWPGGLWDWLDPYIVVEALVGLPPDVTIEFWGVQSPDPRAPRMTTARRLEQQIDAAGLSTRVTLVDWVPRGEFDARLARFDVAVTFDDAGDEAKHAFRTRLLHALACGVPTLVTEGEFVADLAASRGAGWTIPPGDAEALRSTLALLRDDHDRIDRARTSASELAKEFSYPLLVEPLVTWIADRHAPRVARSTGVPLATRLRRVLRKRLG